MIAQAIEHVTEDEAIEFLLCTHGQGLEDELNHAIPTLQARIERNVTSFRNSPDRGVKKLVEFLQSIAPLIRRRMGLEERLERVRRMRNPDSTSVAGDGGASLAEEVQYWVQGAWGIESAETIRQLQGEIEAKLKERVPLLRSELEKILQPHEVYRACNGDRAERVAGIPNETLRHEDHLEFTRNRLALIKVNENRLARLTQELGRAVQCCAEASAVAVKAAGGPDIIARGIREQRLLAEQWYQADVEYPQLAALEVTLNENTVAASRLGLSTDKQIKPEQGTYAARVVETIKTTTKQIKDLKEKIDLKQQFDTVEMVNRCIAGDEAARKEIAMSAAKLRAAFPEGFTRQIHEAQFQGSEFGAMLDDVLYEENRELEILIPFQASLRRARFK